MSPGRRSSFVGLCTLHPMGCLHHRQDKALSARRGVPDEVKDYQPGDLCVVAREGHSGQQVRGRLCGWAPNAA